MSQTPDPVQWRDVPIAIIEKLKQAHQVVIFQPCNAGRVEATLEAKATIVSSLAKKGFMQMYTLRLGPKVHTHMGRPGLNHILNSSMARELGLRG